MSAIDNLKERGFNLIPLKPKSKEPIGGFNWKEYQEEKYTGSFPSTCNIGVVCGRSSGNLFVVDLDDESLIKDFEEFKTLKVKTGKGQHLYFHFHGFPPPNKKLDDKRGRHIDIKSQGGYVLAPSSVHPNGSVYTIVDDSPIMDISGTKLREKLESIGFSVETRTVSEIAEGLSEGGRNDGTFKYTCYLIREKGLYGQALHKEVEELNKRHRPPMPDSELRLVISQAEKAERHNMAKHIDDARTVLQQLGGAPQTLKMQDITPSLEGKPIEFNCMIIAVGERMTYTVSADYQCPICKNTTKAHCNELHMIATPYCVKDKTYYAIDDKSKVTAYIQQLRIQEFFEEARNSSPIQFDAEITDESVGEAFIGQRKTVTAKFRSIQKTKNAYNNIVFQITDMKDIEQSAGCLPTEEEINKWKSENIFQRVTESVVPDIYMNPKIIQTLILWACGGNSLNGKRDLIHCAILGDAQLGKSELLLKMNKLLDGSGYTVGRNVSGAGLTIATVKLYNGTLMPQAGFFPQHTGHHCILDEIDKMKKEDHNSCLEVMEQQTTSQAKAGSGGGLTLPAKCPILVAGNPKNGKFNTKYPSVMDNFEMEAPFVSRFDIIWLLVDANDPETDEKMRKWIRSYNQRKERYMEIDELKRYFTYIQTLDAFVPDIYMDRIDALHKKMRPLNVSSGVPIGLRQYHGLYRLLTASAKAHLRNEVTVEDFDVVEGIIEEAYKSMKMDLKSGEVTGNFNKKKDTNDSKILEAIHECQDKEYDYTIDKVELANKINFKLNKFDGHDRVNKLISTGILELDNDLERYRKVG